MAEITDTDTASLISETQQLYLLNFIANLAGQHTGTESQLEEALKKAIIGKALILGWHLVWGPRVWKVDPERDDTPPTNAWYVAKKGKKCVLAIAGTAPKSLSGWSQNFDVISSVHWDNWVSGWPKQGAIKPPTTDRANDSIATIAHGTAEGVRNILTSESNQIANGTYVQDFLRQQPAGTEIYVVGHSMGGALAPTVALGLLQSGIITNSSITVMASAGASPGNAKFAQAWASHEKLSGQNFYNTKDPIPQGWQLAAGKDRCFPNIYNVIFKDQNEKALGRIKTIVKLGEDASRTSNITYTPVRGQPFTSKIPIPNLGDLPDDSKLIPVIHVQHVNAYLLELGLPNIIKKCAQIFDETEGVGIIPEWKNALEDN